MCRAGGLGKLLYFWERSYSSWTTVSNDNATSYTTNKTLTTGEYMYRCRVNNEAGSVVSNSTTVNVYGEYCPNIYNSSIHRPSHYHNLPYQSVCNVNVRTVYRKRYKDQLHINEL